MLDRTAISTTVENFSEEKSLLRLLTCGSVDDGKSTLIGRLLYECGAVLEDQIEALERDSRKHGTDGDNLDFALLVDGLTAEREQGITIDVAYRYFATNRRAFIVADTPGHEQYTRNMATGASTADLAILLVDARKGLLVQTRRHAFIASLLRIPHIVLAVNKMDLVGFDEKVFRGIERAFSDLAAGLGFSSLTAIPVNARGGDNIVSKSDATPWYFGSSLLTCLEDIDIETRSNEDAFLFPVQWVNRPDASFRGFSGTLAAGSASPRDAVVALPSGRKSTIARIVSADGDMAILQTGHAATLVLSDEIDVSRGDVLASPGAAQISTGTSVRAFLVWTVSAPAREQQDYLLQLAASQTQARIETLHHGVDMESFLPEAIVQLDMNGVALVTLSLQKELAFADYRDSAMLGGFILIDRFSNDTVAIGMIDSDATISDRMRTDPSRPASNKWMTSLRAGLEGRFGIAGTQRRLDIVVQTSWSLASAALVAAIVLIASASLVAAMLGAAADLALRPLLRRTHVALWRGQRARYDMNSDGGAI